MTRPHIRRFRADDLDILVDIWERSVRATHHFLPEEEIEFFRPLVRQGLGSNSLELWILANDEDHALGFMGLSGSKIEALFFAPEHRGRGGGRQMVAHAQALHPDQELRVDVNEQNDTAVCFYQAMGFVVDGRSPLDSLGKPYPLLHMRRTCGPSVGTQLPQKAL